MKTAGSLSSGWRRRRASLPATVVGLAITVLAVSCGHVPKTCYYTLKLSTPLASSDPKTTFALGVEHFRSAEILRDDRILYYESPTEMNFYQNHRWGSDPATMLSELALEWIARTGIFTYVKMLPSREPTDYVLRGRVFNFEELDYEGVAKARVTLELTLVRSRDRKMVWSDLRQVENPIQGTGIVGVVNALNVSSQQLLRESLPGLVAQIEQDYKASREPSR
jgi:ABC-type uncharacterized transport system auxiliary subunit